jgi:glycerophosphoryl diester phosphodiesterase
MRDFICVLHYGLRFIRDFGTPGNALESDSGSGVHPPVTSGTKPGQAGFGKDGSVRPITFAHRGGRADGPENTLPAFRRALEHGATGLESDARLTVDGEVVLVHDAVARRGPFRGARVDQSTAAELEAFDVPRLADLYAELGTDYELSLDLYDRAARVPVLDVATAAAATDHLWVCAGGIETLVELGSRGTGAHLVHSTRRQKITGSVERHAARVAEEGIAAVNMHYTDWTKGLVELYHRFDVLTFAWDVQEVRHLRAVLAMRMDAVYSDYVDRMVATVAEWSE